MKPRRTRVRRTTAPLVTGVAWYKPEQYLRVRELSTDKDGLHETYDEWRVSAEDICLKLLGEGVAIKKVEVDLGDMLAWCRLHGKDFNGAARSEYVAHKLNQAAE